MIINGIGVGLFGGDSYVTRAEFAGMSIRALSLPENGDGSVFSDAPQDEWYCGAVGR